MEHYSAIKMEGLLIIHMTIWMNYQRMKLGFPGGAVVKNLPANAGDAGDSGFCSWVGKIPWRRKWQSTPAFMPGKFHGQRSLVGYGPWGCKESDTTERLRHSVCQGLHGHQGHKHEDKARAWLTPSLCPSALTPPHSLSPALYSNSCGHQPTQVQ